MRAAVHFERVPGGKVAMVKAPEKTLELIRPSSSAP